MNTKTKICGRCGQRKQMEEFNFKYKSDGVRHSYCRECGKDFTGSHYLRNRDYYIRKARKNTAKARREAREKLVEYLKTHPCVDCGETDIIVLQFDHVRGKKRESLSNMVRKGASWQVMEIEIAKCEIRCANCHARRTAKQRDYYAYRES